MPTKADADSAQLQRKATVIAEIRKRLDDADAAVLTEYRGLTVSEIAALRAALRPAATDYKIFKNTLARRAATDSGLADMVEQLQGPVAIAFVRQDGGDAVTAAKALRDFAKANPNLVVKGGILGTRLLSTKEIEALADVPPRDELLARLAGGFQAPLSKAAGLFQAFTRNFAYGLKAYADLRAEQEPPAAVASAPPPEPEPDAPAAEAEPTESQSESQPESENTTPEASSETE
jgi:large subunit ribosomal protein L10